MRDNILLKLQVIKNKERSECFFAVSGLTGEWELVSARYFWGRVHSIEEKLRLKKEKTHKEQDEEKKDRN